MDDFDDGGGLTDAQFADLMSRAVPDGQMPSTEASPPTAPSNAPSPETVGAPAEPTAPANAAQPDGVVAAAATPASDASQTIDPATATPGAEPPSSTSPAWDSPENPYYLQQQQLNAAVQEAARIARETQQQQQTQAQQRAQAEEEAAAQELIRRLPDLEPDEQVAVVQNLMAWRDGLVQDRIAGTEAMLESVAARVVYDDLAREYQLNANEKAEMERIPNAEYAKLYAMSKHQVRQEVRQQMEANKQTLEQGQMQRIAQDRLASGVDNVGGGGGAPASMATATNIDEFWAAFDLATR
jgi:hypothetical protein